MDAAAAYKLIGSVASPSDAEGLTKPRSILLLWYLRNALGIGDLEAYEFVCDADGDRGIDGLYLEEPNEQSPKYVLHIYQSKYPEKPKNVGERDVRITIGSAAPFYTGDGLRRLKKGAVAPDLLRLIERFDLERLLDAKEVVVESTLVTAGTLTSEARDLIEAENARARRIALRGVDALDLGPLVEAFTTPVTVTATVKVNASKSERFVAPITNARVAVCSVGVSEIVSWPGIDDRRLFDLNVRQEINRTGKVRQALDAAVRKEADHKNFLAFHNGLTVICNKIDDSNDNYLTITNLSVVNGAQSTVSFRENRSYLTAGLRVLVKFVEAPAERQFTREVAVRSNTQNPVNARNLRARDGVQLRIENEMRQQYSSITYVLRPDESLKPTGKAIQNDEAAQLLCAVYNEEPWNAVRRLYLFEADSYPRIFGRDATAGRVVLVDRIAERVQALKKRFPDEYLKSWRLTKLVAVYLVGQLLRTKPELKGILEKPDAALAVGATTDGTLDQLVKFAAAAMNTRREEILAKAQPDDFKVDFKREDSLRELALKAKTTYTTYRTVED